MNAFQVLPKDWTEAQEDALATDVCARLATTRTIKGEFSCVDQATASHWAQVVQRIHEAHMDVIHTAGTAWVLNSTLKWNFSAWPAKLKEPFGERVAAWQASHPGMCWYWNAEPPYLPPCHKCQTCLDAEAKKA